jgi:2-keto-4-pentenoate hydratase/2-oxohepta-3-ene-1,7-dioic acid hydratase in catechol pathway
MTTWCRFRVGARESYGLVEDEQIVEVDGTPLGEHRVGRGRHPLRAVKLLPPIMPRVLYAAGPNYRGHLEAMARRRGEPPRYPARPEPKLRSINAIIGTEDDIVVPKESTGAVQPEGQLAVVIGQKARNIAPRDALDCVLGYSIGNDVSQREWQKTDRTLFRAKNCDTFKPFGPFIVTGLDPAKLRIVVRHNGTVWDVGGLLVRRPDLGHGHLALRDEQDRDAPSWRRALDGHRGRRRRHGARRRDRGRDRRHRRPSQPRRGREVGA